MLAECIDMSKSSFRLASKIEKYSGRVSTWPVRAYIQANWKAASLQSIKLSIWAKLASDEFEEAFELTPT